MSFFIVLIFSLIYSIFSNIIEIFIKKDEKVQKIYKKIEVYIKKGLREKVFESYLKLFYATKKYVFLSLLFGIFILIVLWFILKNAKIFIPILNLNISWFYIYIFLVFTLNLIFKYFFRLIFKTWEKK